jgi:integrase
MASIRARKENGLLFFDFRYRGRRCREQTLLPDTPANRKRLEKVLEKFHAEIASGTFDYARTFPNSKGAFEAPAKQDSARGSPVQAVSAGASDAASTSRSPLFNDFVTSWFKNHEVEWRRSHIQVLRSTIDTHLKPYFGNKRVGEITKSDILAFRARLSSLPGRKGEKLSNKRINGIMGPLRQILAEAAEMHDFPTQVETLKPLRIQKSDVEPFTLTQVQQILTTVRPDYHDYFVVRFFTGMRTGEAHGLQWQYVDFESRLIFIRETFVLGEDEYTKTDGSQRDIQMSQVVYEALTRQKEATGKLSKYVFCNREGKPLDNKNFTDRVWYPLLRHLDLKPRTPYQCRHTAATLWLASGEAPEWIARQLGHTSTEMLFRVYSRYVPNLTRRDGSAIDRLLSSRFSTGTTTGKGDAANGRATDGDAKPPPAIGRALIAA